MVYLIKRTLFSAALLAVSIVAARAADFAGTWLTQEGESKIRLAPCGAQWCGALIWLREPNDGAGQPLRDAANADLKLRGRPMLGLPLMSGLIRSGAELRGKIYNPEDGKNYDGVLSLRDEDHLQIKGCVAAVFCQTETLTRMK